MSLGSIELGRNPAAVLRPLSFRSVVVDFPLLVTILAICAYGLIVLYSALEENSALLIRQGVRLGIALGALGLRVCLALLADTLMDDFGLRLSADTLPVEHLPLLSLVIVAMLIAAAIPSCSAYRSASLARAT